MTPTEIDKLQYLQIGVQGENIALTVPVDMTAWAEAYPGATFHVLFRPYNVEAPAPQTSSYDATEKILTWEIGAGATAVVGVGYTEIRAQDGNGLIKKTRVIPTAVDNSVSGVSENPPKAYEDWVTRVLNAGAAVLARSMGAEIGFELDEETGHLIFFTEGEETDDE